MMSYSFEWVPGLAVLAFTALFWVPPMAMIVLLLVVLAAVAAVAALLVAGPYLLVRTAVRRWHHLPAREPAREVVPAPTDELVGAH
jgi:hypothetical protein